MRLAGRTKVAAIAFYARGPRPLAARFAPQLPRWAAASFYGVELWIFALYVMAHLVAGNPAFLGFTGITWVALVGHVIFALVAAAVVRWREAQSSLGVR
jgi:hypothetical protein